jgi:hypothetical protein
MLKTVASTFVAAYFMHRCLFYTEASDGKLIRRGLRWHFCNRSLLSGVTLREGKSTEETVGRGEANTGDTDFVIVADHHRVSGPQW